MKMWRLIHHRSMILPFLTCCLLALLAAGTVNLGSPAAWTPIGSSDPAGLPQTTQGTSPSPSIPLTYVNPNGQVTRFFESNGAIELLNNYTITAPNQKTGVQLWVTQRLI